MSDTKHQTPYITVQDCLLLVITLIVVVVGISFLVPPVPGPVDRVVMSSFGF